MNADRYPAQRTTHFYSSTSRHGVAVWKCVQDWPLGGPHAAFPRDVERRKLREGLDADNAATLIRALTKDYDAAKTFAQDVTRAVEFCVGVNTPLAEDPSVRLAY